MKPDERHASLDLLYPPFRDALVRALLRAKGKGVVAYPFETWRSPGRQGVLYSQGRTELGSIVTNALAWQSWHQYGLACDLAFGGPGAWNWAGDWQTLGEAMMAEGLEWYGAPGAPFKETPHVQRIFGLTLAEARFLATTDGILAVWAAAANATATLPESPKPST